MGGIWHSAATLNAARGIYASILLTGKLTNKTTDKLYISLRYHFSPPLLLWYCILYTIIHTVHQQHRAARQEAKLVSTTAAGRAGAGRQWGQQQESKNSTTNYYFEVSHDISNYYLKYFAVLQLKKHFEEISEGIRSKKNTVLRTSVYVYCASPSLRPSRNEAPSSSRYTYGKII